MTQNSVFDYRVPNHFNYNTFYYKQDQLENQYLHSENKTIFFHMAAAG